MAENDPSSSTGSPNPEPNPRSVRMRGRLVQILTAVGLAGLFALYFLVYVPTQEAGLTELKFGLVADMAEQVGDSLANLHTALANAATALAGTGKPNERRAKFTEAVGQINPAVSLPEIVIKPPPSSSESQTNAPESSSELPGLARSAERRVFRVSELSPWQEIRSYRLSLTYTNRIGSWFKAEVNFGDLLQPILDRYQFEDIVLTQTNGDVIFQMSQYGRRVTNTLATADLRITRLPDVNLTQGSNSISGTRLTELSLAGTKYKMFGQPLRVALGRVNPEWYICGLVKVRDVTAATWEIPTTWTIAFVFAAVGLLVLWPFLNIAFSGPTAYVSGLEVAWLLCGSFFGCAGLIYLVLYAGAYLQSEDDSDAHLRQLAGEVRSRVVCELRRARELLTTADRALVEQAANPAASNSLSGDFRRIGQVVTNKCPSLIEVFWVASNGDETAKITLENRQTEFVPVGDRGYFTNIINGAGWAWETVDVGLDSICTNTTYGDTNCFYVESIFSKTRNANVAAFSQAFPTNRVTSRSWPSTNVTFTNGDFVMRFRVPERTNNVLGPSVSVITFQPSSLFAPVLPAGYGFCIVDKTGQVLFHSDSRRNLHENFIKEAARRQRLQAAIYSRTTDSFDAAYLTQTHHVHVTPMKGFPWTLVVFRNERLVDTVHRNTLLTASAFFGLYLAALLSVGGLALIGWWIRHQRTISWWSWLWPKQLAQSHHQYRVLIEVAGAMVCFLGILASKSATGLTVFGVLLPVMTLAAACLPGREFKRKLGVERWHGLASKVMALIARLSRTPSDHHEAVSDVAHVVSLCLGFMLLAMIPALASYKLAFGQEAQLYVKGTQLKLARELQEGQSAWPGGSTLYSAFFYQTATNLPSQIKGPIKDESSPWINGLYDACRPYLDESDLRTSGLLATKAADGSWFSSFDGNTLRLTVDNGGDSRSNSAVQISSTIPELVPLSLPWPPGPEAIWHSCWYLLILAVLAGPFLVSRFVARHILLLNLPSDLRKTTASSSDVTVTFTPELIPVETNDSRDSTFVALEKTRVRVVRISPEDALVDSGEKGRASHKYHKNDGLEKWSILVRMPRGEALNEDRKEKIRDSVVKKFANDYRAKWGGCSAKEKLTLYQIAQSGFVSPSRIEVRTLLDRRLLKFGPELRLCDESFRRFVLGAYRSKEIQKSLQAEEEIYPALNWRSLRGGIGVGISVAVLFLFVTQKELWQLALGLATAFATASQDFSKITGLFQRIQSPQANPAPRELAD